MGQACCVPRKHPSKRTAKIKAEARSATASGHIRAAIPQGAQGASSMTEAQADLLHAGRIDELREIHALSNSPSRVLREPREWLQQKKQRLTAQPGRNGALLPDRYTHAKNKHKQKVRVARNEASFGDNNEPITLLEATLLEDLHFDEVEGRSTQTTTPPDDVHEPRAHNHIHVSSETSQGRAQPQPQPCLGKQPSREVVSPIPRRPASSLRFPFMDQTSDASTGSSRRSSRAGDGGEVSNEEAQPGTESAESDRDSAGPPEDIFTASAETVIARKISIDDDDDRTDAGSVRYSISSLSPEIFYEAPSSPQSRPAVHISTPAVTVTRATPPTLPLQLPATQPSTVDSSRLNATPLPGSQWARTASSPPVLLSRPEQSSNSLEAPPNITQSDPSPFVPSSFKSSP